MFENKSILVIGGTGTIGQALTKKLLLNNPKVVRIFSRDEFKQFNMQQEYTGVRNIRFLIGDVREKERLDRAMHGIDIVFNLAALKHVPACEYNPFEAVKTNVIGAQNVIECAISHRLNRVVYTSSDKAISPTNTMGATKLLAERLIAAADYSKGGTRPIFSAVRFGNVIGSRGSVIPLWEKQIIEERCITITDPNMTRFMMSTDQAIQLLLKATEYAEGGEIFVFKMPVIRLGDLAQAVIEKTCEKYGIDVGQVEKKVIGLRPGEKLFEELMTSEEISRAEELEDMFKIGNINNGPYDNEPEVNNYSTNSSTHKLLSVEEIKEKLLG